MNDNLLPTIFSKLERRALPRRQFVHYLAKRLQLKKPRRLPWLASMILVPAIVAIVFVVTWPKPQAVVGLNRQEIMQSLQKISFADDDQITRYDFFTTTGDRYNTQSTIWYYDHNARVDRTTINKSTGVTKTKSYLYSRLDQLYCAYQKVVKCKDLTKVEQFYKNSNTREKLFSEPSANLDLSVDTKLEYTIGESEIHSVKVKVQWVTPQPIAIGRVILHDHPEAPDDYLMTVRISTEKTELNKKTKAGYQHTLLRYPTVEGSELYVQVDSDGAFSDILKINVSDDTIETVDPYSLPLLQNEISQFTVDQEALKQHLLMPQFLSEHLDEVPAALLTTATGTFHDQPATSIFISQSALKAINSTDLFLDPTWDQAAREIKLWFSPEHELLGYEMFEANGSIVYDVTINRTTIQDDPEQWFEVAAWKAAVTGE